MNGVVIKVSISHSAKLSVVIPCHNCQDYIGETIKTVLKNIPVNSEIILVENGSTDESFSTAKNIAREFGTIQKEILVIRSQKGLGNALREGMSLTRGEIVAFMADDLPFGVQELELLQECESQPETIFAISKYLPKSTYQTSFARKMLGNSFALIRRLFLETSLRDTQGSLVGNGNSLRKYFDATREEAFLVTTELHELLFRNNIKVIEVPCAQSNYDFRESTIKLKSIISMGIGLIRISLRQKIKK